MKVHVKHTLKTDVASALKLCTELKSQEEIYAKLGGTDVKIKREGLSPNVRLKISRREVANPPAAIRKLVPSTNEVSHTEDWAADGKGYSADIVIDIKGVPVIVLSFSMPRKSISRLGIQRIDKYLQQDLVCNPPPPNARCAEERSPSPACTAVNATRPSKAGSRVAPSANSHPTSLNSLRRLCALEGKIKHMEEEVGLSYPTIRNRLNEVIRALGYEPGKDEPVEITQDKRNSILEDLSAGKISAEEATRLLRGEEAL